MSAARRWSALAVLILPVLLISIDMTVLGIAVPALSADLKPTSTQLLWIIDLYSFLLAGPLVLMGSVGDRIGRRRLLLIGAPLFGLASVMAAFATSPGLLHLSAGVMVGFGLSAASFNLVLAAFGKLLPNEWKSLGFGAATAAGSFGQFLFAPFGVAMIDNFGWQPALTVFANILNEATNCRTSSKSLTTS